MQIAAVLQLHPAVLIHPTLSAHADMPGDLPYMLALDRPTKSIVVAIRGTVSVADLATDMLADPEPMEEWLPDTMTQVQLHHTYIHTSVPCM